MKLSNITKPSFRFLFLRVLCLRFALLFHVLVDDNNSANLSIICLQTLCIWVQSIEYGIAHDHISNEKSFFIAYSLGADMMTARSFVPGLSGAVDLWSAIMGVRLPRHRIGVCVNHLVQDMATYDCRGNSSSRMRMRRGCCTVLLLTQDVEIGGIGMINTYQHWAVLLQGGPTKMNLIVWVGDDGMKEQHLLLVAC